MSRRWSVGLSAVVLVVAVCLGVVIGWRAFTDDGPWRLANPRPATIRELGRVKPSALHDCSASIDGRCFDYLDGWCQAPCTTYRVEGTIESIRPIKDRAYGGFVVVLRDGNATIAARARLFRKWLIGDRVRATGVLFFPRPRRDGAHAPNGAELSPLYAMTHA